MFTQHIPFNVNAGGKCMGPVSDAVLSVLLGCSCEVDRCIYVYICMYM